MRTPKGTPTHLNLFVLERLFGERAKAGTKVANRIESTSAPHLRRCFRAGLVEVVGSDGRVVRGELALTAAGEDALRGYFAKEHRGSCLCCGIAPGMRVRPSGLGKTHGWLPRLGTVAGVAAQSIFVGWDGAPENHETFAHGELVRVEKATP